MKTAILVFVSFLIARPQPQQTLPPPGEPAAEERRIAEEEMRRAEAEERARVQQKLDQLDEDLNNMHRTPASALELEAMRRQLFPQFVRNVSELREESRELIAASRTGTAQEVKKKAKRLEGYVGRILEYLLDGEEPPEPPQVIALNDQMPDRIARLGHMAESIHRRLKEFYVNNRAGTIDANLAVALVQDLQTLKALSHSLRR